MNGKDGVKKKKKEKKGTTTHAKAEQLLHPFIVTYTVLRCLFGMNNNFPHGSLSNVELL